MIEFLTVNNLIHVNNGAEEVYAIVGIHGEQVDVKNITNEKDRIIINRNAIIPIKLNDFWLKRFKFAYKTKKHHPTNLNITGWYSTSLRSEHTNLILLYLTPHRTKEGEIFYSFIMNELAYLDINYVHQLQNLVKVFFNKELRLLNENLNKFIL